LKQAYEAQSNLVIQKDRYLLEKNAEIALLRKAIAKMKRELDASIRDNWIGDKNMVIAELLSDREALTVEVARLKSHISEICKHSQPK